MLVLAGLSLKCYKCQSDVSWAECEKNLTSIQCDPTHDRCVKYNYDAWSGTNKSSIMARDCLQGDQCSSSHLQSCRNVQATKMTCLVKCCGTDLCNKGFGIHEQVGFLQVATAFIVCAALFLKLA